jgi:hypothetical protein
MAVVGSFVLFTEKRDVLEVIRAIPSSRANDVSSTPTSRN